MTAARRRRESAIAQSQTMAKRDERRMRVILRSAWSAIRALGALDTSWIRRGKLSSPVSARSCRRPVALPGVRRSHDLFYRETAQGLESLCTFIAYRGFESHPVRTVLCDK